MNSTCFLADSLVLAVARRARLFCLLIGAFFVAPGCQDGVVLQPAIDFGEVYIVGSYEASAPIDNNTAGPRTATEVSFDDGTAFQVLSELPLVMDRKSPYPVDFAFVPPAGGYGLWEDVAHFLVVPSTGDPITVSITLTGLFTNGDQDSDGVVDIAYGGDDCDDLDPDIYGGPNAHEEICDGKDNNCDAIRLPDEGDVDGDTFLGCIDDCDDNDARNFPGNLEVCDGQDNDCTCSGDTDGDGVICGWGDVGVDEGFDVDLDGHSVCGPDGVTDDPLGDPSLWDDDCDDAVAVVFPGNPEVCDGYDNDCSAGGFPSVDEVDDDGDGYLPCSSFVNNGAGFVGGGDCADELDDLDSDGVLDTSLIHPTVVEVCDGIDNDCDAALLAGEVDADLDGVLVCDGDCDDDPATGANNFPGNPEVCDGEDNDCDVVTAAGGGELDQDSDGSLACDDCDDLEPDSFPGNPEVCDGVNNDCVGAADFTTTDDDGGGETDTDGDLALDCADCADNDPANFPGNPEVCDGGEDNDCNPVTADTGDADGDGFSPCGADGSPDTGDEDCDDSPDDLNADGVPDGFPTNPAAVEICDGQDNNCDGTADFVTTDDDGGGEVDTDGDGDPDCADCEDGNPQNFPSNAEACDGADNDCNGLADADVLGEVDGDGDGTLSCDDCDDDDSTAFVGNTEVCDGVDNDCVAGADFVTTDDDGGGEIDSDFDAALDCEDCDDADAANSPLNLEVCDGQDNDCEAATDELVDGDGDTFPVCGTSGDGSDGDCDDTQFSVNPDALEVCDGVDTDCDGELLFGEDFDSDGDGTLDCPGLDPDCPQHVDEAATGTPDGTVANPWTTIGAGQAAIAGGVCTTLWVAPGTYSEAITWPAGVDFRLVSTDGADETTIDSQTLSGRTITVDGGQTTTALLQGFLVTGGSVTGDGGGILVSGSSFTLRDVNVTGNSATGHGGGVFVQGGDIVIEDSSFATNIAGLHGGGLAVDQGQPRVSNSTFNLNLAGDNGGGIYVSTAHPVGPGIVAAEISQNYIYSNDSVDGGGLYLADFAGQVTQNAISNNEADDGDSNSTSGRGGGLYMSDGSSDRSFSSNVYIANNVFNGNTSKRGAGMFTSNTVPTFENNTLVDNVGTDNASPSTLRVFLGTYRNNIIVSGTGFGLDIGSAGAAPYGAPGALTFEYNDLFGFTEASLTDESEDIFVFGYLDNDQDSDGIIDAEDPDADGNGVPDVDEGGVDSDGDGVIDEYDIDADNDGEHDFLDPDTDGNIELDPLFVSFTDNDNPLDDDLSLQASSPCVDAGDPSLVYDDVDGSINDMGAFGGALGDWTPTVPGS